MLSKGQIVSELQLFAFSGSIIDRWLQLDDQHQVLRRLATVNEEPLSHVELNQLLLLSHEAAVSDAFFEYYWLSKPEHSYNIDAIPGHDAAWHGSPKITSLEQLKWGLYRIYVDGLLYFGNVRRGFRATRSKNNRELAEFFGLRRFDTKAIRRRGAPLPLAPVVKDDRYLISEMACKSYGINPFQGSDLKTALVDAWREHSNAGGGGIPLRRLLAGDLIRQRYQYQQYELQFSIDDIVEEVITSEDDLTRKYERIAQRFSRARENAMQNTELYLSMINDLDVYVATSMRSRKDFREMADNCEKIFSDSRLRELHLRYFDPTLSAAAGHEDKGLIECLMVKSAKALIYCAGEKDSYGKDAEAAMALSLGKPVIFFCDVELKQRFFKEVHPLSRLIDFQSGIAVGAMVTASLDEGLGIAVPHFREQNGIRIGKCPRRLPPSAREIDEIHCPPPDKQRALERRILELLPPPAPQ